MPRAEIRLDCFETRAPIWLSRGRLWKYLTTSSVDRRSALPITITALQHMPREKQADLRVVFNLMRFAAAEVGIKHQPFFVVVLQQHNALVGLAALIDGGNHHGRRVGKFRIAGLTQPAFKQRQGFSKEDRGDANRHGCIHGANAQFAGVRRYQTWPLRM